MYVRNNIFFANGSLVFRTSVSCEEGEDSDESSIELSELDAALAASRAQLHERHAASIKSLLGTIESLRKSVADLKAKRAKLREPRKGARGQSTETCHE